MRIFHISPIPRPSLLMPQRTRFPRFALALLILLALCAGVFSPRGETAGAMPLQAADELNVFISEFRVRGPNGADDEFVEIYNASGGNVDIGNWIIVKSSGCGATETTLTTIPINTILAPGQYYLVVKDGYYSGAITHDRSYTVTGIADDGGIALKDDAAPTRAIIDQVGLCATTLFKEGSTLSSMSGTANQSYERKDGGSAGSCKDTDNNATDFIFNSSTSNPQNSASAAVPCLAVIDVYSLSNVGTIVYLDTSSAVIDIQLEFSNIVTVTGSPTLLMEVGVTDRNAIYVSGSGTDTLMFNYTIQPGDNTSDLDYASFNALSLNGGTIVGATGNATLILPKPNVSGSGSLSDNEDIRINTGSITPSFISFTRQNPASENTNADELVFRATFNEAMLNVDMLDFAIVTPSTTASITQLTRVENGRMYDLRISGGNLALFNGDVNLDLLPVNDITNVGGTPLPSNVPTLDQTYKVDNNPPTITTLSQTATQIDPTNTFPINFDLVFSEAVDTSTFTTTDIKQNGTATGINWTITNSGNNQNFTLSVVASGAGFIYPSMDATKIKDLAGNDNSAYVPAPCAPLASSCVEFQDSTPPTVTINQAAGQFDPTSALPINFTVQFSEVINTATFTTGDITQSGTATGTVWSIANSGDNMTFTLSATASGYGTLIPSIAANKVLDLSGNNNTASASADNSVAFAAASARSVIINEVAWAGTTSSLTGDEWIELYNTTNASINITGWTLKASDGTPTITLNGTISAGGYFLLERDDDTTVSDIPADQIYTGELSNSGEALSLLDGSGTVIDTANGNGGSWPKGSSSTYETMERIGTSTENDSSWLTNTSVKRNGKNANGGNILGTPKSANSQAATPTPSPTPPPTSTPAPTQIVIPPRPIINEIHARPGFDWNQDGRADVFDEFIEIKNLTAVDISLSGWKLDTVNGKKSFTLPDVTLKPGERIVYYSKETNLLLSDGGETVRLSNASGKIYDAFTYTVARAEDQSFCRLPDGNPGDSWFEDCVPTPNLTNTREGQTPASPNGNASPVCNLPDTIPLDFFIPECNGYGADIWNPYYWDFANWIDKLWIQQTNEKWRTFIE
jgi:hypothetical protein